MDSIGCRNASFAFNYKPEGTWGVDFDPPIADDYITTLFGELFF